MAPRPVVITVIIAVAVIALVAIPINWGAIQWGTVPTWIGAIALLLVAAGIWAAVLTRNDVRDRSDHTL
jgi:protein-S-isoprenylcysteine O-methyltransferase Ste14